MWFSDNFEDLKVILFLFCEHLHALNVCLVSGDQKKEPNFMELELWIELWIALSCGLESKPRSLIGAFSALNYSAFLNKYEISSWALAEAYTVVRHCNPPLVWGAPVSTLVQWVIFHCSCQRHCSKSVWKRPYLHRPTKKATKRYIIIQSIF